MAKELALLKEYQAFMAGYVRRINEATLRVTIGGVRIGTAKYTRLAQINLKSRIITFSRYAIENVPERGRRYLVIHELAHVKEASHNKKFWNLVEQFEPSYKEVGKSIQRAFSKNVRAYIAPDKPSPEQGSAINQILLSPFDESIKKEQASIVTDNPLFYPADAGISYADDDVFDCMEDEFILGGDRRLGVIYGGSDFDTH